jgi:hypothetical protein
MDTVSIEEVKLGNLVAYHTNNPEFPVYIVDKTEDDSIIMDDLDVTLSIRSGACTYEQLKTLQENILNYLEDYLTNSYRTVLMEEKVRYRKDNENPFVLLNVAIKTLNLEIKMGERYTGPGLQLGQHITRP